MTRLRTGAGLFLLDGAGNPPPAYHVRLAPDGQVVRAEVRFESVCGPGGLGAAAANLWDESDG